ncbi:MAG: hypothetical protein NT132_01830 [Microbacterium sp.]|uniref:hypothetical protein n=1 Tax=Microbacterium sp. TaxID=51671 RepID=UPI00262650CB|nr:hypothetical protein [Microbacterium sp.]MCX6501147.1 hypothetical protein [Microbacterium sp.]
MSLFTRKKNTPNVPAHLADAYAAATPDATAFLERAAAELALEHYYPDSYKPSERRGSTEHTGRTYGTDPEQRQRMYVDHFPELLARAEHLSRLQAARWAVEMPKRFAAAAQETAARHTCPVCKTISPDEHARYSNPALGRTGYDAPLMCAACRSTADLLFSQASATPERRAAVLAALEIPAPLY